jgi:hypothetical protein
MVIATFTAEYGRNPSGQVNVITRSGANQWHGDLYSLLRNRSLDARNFFDGARKPGPDRSESGAGLGGRSRRTALSCSRTSIFCGNGADWRA